jgi:hypothetical protein
MAIAPAAGTAPAAGLDPRSARTNERFAKSELDGCSAYAVAVAVTPAAEIVDVVLEPAQIGEVPIPAPDHDAPATKKITGSASGENFLMSPQVSPHAINTMIARGNR